MAITNLHLKLTDRVQQLLGRGLLCDTEHSEGLGTGGSVDCHPVLLQRTFLL